VVKSDWSTCQHSCSRTCIQKRESRKGLQVDEDLGEHIDGAGCRLCITGGSCEWKALKYAIH